MNKSGLDLKALRKHSFATLVVDDNEIAQLPIVGGTADDNVALDIRSLRKETGLITLDAGFKNTGILSNITATDPVRGRL